jgi:hypothetical protein
MASTSAFEAAKIGSNPIGRYKRSTYIGECHIAVIISAFQVDDSGSIPDTHILLGHPYS